MKVFRFSLMVLFFSIFLFACNNGQSGEETDHSEHTEMQEGHMNSSTEKDKTGPEYTSKYICPMHCKGSGSDKPGKCPVCGMDYKPNEEG